MDGIMVGRLPASSCGLFCNALRLLKVKRHTAAYFALEIVAIPSMEDRLFPGIFLATTPARMMRPVGGRARHGLLASPG